MAFFVIEGTDGAGKTVQTRLLVRRLRREGYRVATFDFPQYGSESSYFVREYLSGRYGAAEEVGPKLASILYAMDRFDVGRRIRGWLEAGRVVVSNRYVSSNMGHQGSKIRTRAARQRFFGWLADFEHGLLEIPKPTLTVLLHMPAATAQRLLLGKERRTYLGKRRRDIHESNLAHLRSAERTYLEMARTFPRQYRVVECVRNGEILSPREIHQSVWRIAHRALPRIQRKEE